jgi:hypothetical protein
MAKFDAFTFLANRKRGIEPTPEDLDTFDPFMTQMVLSMKGYHNIIDRLNTKEFFDLPKSIQCMAYTSFDGYSLYAPWKKAKAGKKNKKDDDIHMIMKIYDLSRSEAESCIQFNTVDMDEVTELYCKIYEPEKINFRKSRKKKDK